MLSFHNENQLFSGREVRGMSQHDHQLLLLRKTIFILLLGNFATFTSSCSSDDLYLIRSAQSLGLVLDATNASQIKIQHFTGFTTQLWSFQRANKAGIFYIVSNYTGHVLDFAEKRIFMNEKQEALSQQWTLTSKGVISSVGRTGHCVDVTGGKFSAGNAVQLWPENSSLSQEFVWIKKV